MELINSIDTVDICPALKADTMSVVLKGSDTVHVSVRLKGDIDHDEGYMNGTLRFDRGQCAVLCGYPMEWAIHDINIDYYNPESLTYEEYIDGMGELPIDHEWYVSKDDEIEIYTQFRAALKAHFRDPQWLDGKVPINQKIYMVTQLDNAISRLERR